jgi:hypothetical protein
MESAIEHIAGICCLSRWEGVLMVMLTAAFDVSQDQPGRTFLAMAGFVSEAESWKEFDREWRQRLAADGLTYFHMNPFAQSRGPFNGWDRQEDRRRKLLSDLLDIIVAHARQKFACVVQAKVAAAMPDKAREIFGAELLAIAGSSIVGLVLNWRDREKYQAQPELVFEEGDLGKGALMERIRTLTGQDPIFRRKKDSPQEGITGFTPLQAADILAYEVKKLTDEVGGVLADDFQLRFPYRQLNLIQGEPRIFTLETVRVAEMYARAISIL